MIALGDGYYLAYTWSIVASFTRNLRGCQLIGSMPVFRGGPSGSPVLAILLRSFSGSAPAGAGFLCPALEPLQSAATTTTRPSVPLRSASATTTKPSVRQASCTRRGAGPATCSFLGLSAQPGDSGTEMLKNANLPAPAGGVPLWS